MLLVTLPDRGDRLPAGAPGEPGAHALTQDFHLAAMGEAFGAAPEDRLAGR